MMKNLEQELRAKLAKAERESKKHKRESKKHQRDLEKERKEHNKSKAEVARLQSPWKSIENQKITPDKPYIMHCREPLDMMLSNNHNLHSIIGRDKAEFEALLETCRKEFDNHPDAPLFSEDDRPDPGNRCKLSHRHALLLALVRNRNNAKQELLAVLFGIDQSTVSRYLSFFKDILPKALPAFEELTKMISETKTLEKFKEFMPGRKGGVLYLDGTHVQTVRPPINEADMFSGKNKKFAYNFLIISNKDNLILWTSKLRNGSVHDITILRDELPPFGKWLEIAQNPDTEPEQRQI